MKPKELPPTNAELIGSLDELFRCAHESALFVYWKIIDQQITSHFESRGALDGKVLLGNGILEASLLLIRKSTEFFKPKGVNDKPDTLYAYRYISGWKGTWIVDEAHTYQELHKRVGHITVREVRYGKQVWPVADFTAQVIEQWTVFFTDIRGSALFDGDPPVQKLESYVSSLREVLRGCRALQRKQTGRKS